VVANCLSELLGGPDQAGRVHDFGMVQKWEWMRCCSTMTHRAHVDAGHMLSESVLIAVTSAQRAESDPTIVSSLWP